MSGKGLAGLALVVLCTALLVAGCTTSTTGGTATPTVTKTVTTLATTTPAGTTNTTTIAASKQAVLHTSMGDITIALYDDMPVTTANFETLVRQGFYTNVTFHRVIDQFMIQGGDPTGTGMGGSTPIRDEFPTARKNRNDRGTIAMANAGPNTGSSQFFINLVNNNYLDTKHPVFGRVVKGMDVVDAIGKVPVDANDKPITPVVITSAEML